MIYPKKAFADLSAIAQRRRITALATFVAALIFNSANAQVTFDQILDPSAQPQNWIR